MKAMLDWYHNIQKTEIKRLTMDPNDLLVRCQRADRDPDPVLNR